MSNNIEQLSNAINANYIPDIQSQSSLLLSNLKEIQYKNRPFKYLANILKHSLVNSSEIMIGGNQIFK